MNDFTPITPESVAVLCAFLEAVEKIDALVAHLPEHCADEISAIKHTLFDTAFGAMQ